MNNIIIIQRRNVYGNELIYPICKKARLLAELTGKKTFTVNDVRILENLGYQLRTEAEVLILNN